MGVFLLGLVLFLGVHSVSIVAPFRKTPRTTSANQRSGTNQVTTWIGAGMFSMGNRKPDR